MDKQELQDFLEVSYDKLVGMGACDEGLAWFADQFGCEQVVPLSEALDRITTSVSEGLQYFYWYFEECVPCESDMYKKYHKWTQDLGEYLKVCCIAAYWYDYFKTLDFVYEMECSL